VSVNAINVKVYDNQNPHILISSGSTINFITLPHTVANGVTYTFYVALSPPVPYAEQGTFTASIQITPTDIPALSPTQAESSYFVDTSRVSDLINIYWGYVSSSTVDTYAVYTQANSLGTTLIPYAIYASCLIEDTTVLTDRGYIKVQDLKNNDIIITSDKRSVPIKEVVCMQSVSSPESDPYLFKANCFSDSYPPMNTYLSPHHCILINDKLGTTYSDNKSRWTNGAHLKAYNALSDDLSNDIKQVKIADRFNYYHIYLPDYMTDHLVINNGLIVESYGVDYKDRIIVTTDAIDNRLFTLSVSL